MQYGYVFTDPKRSKIVVITKKGDVELVSSNKKENINLSIIILLLYLLNCDKPLHNYYFFTNCINTALRNLYPNVM